MSEYNPYNIDKTKEPEFMKSGPSSTPFENKEQTTTEPPRKADKIVSLAYSSFLLMLNVLIIVFVLCGCVRFNGTNIDLIYAFRLIINVFGMTSATVYKSLIGGAMAVTFFVCIITTIVRTVRSIRSMNYIVRNRNRRQSIDCGIHKNSINVMYNNFILSFAFVAVFIVISNLLGTSKISGMAIALLVIAGVAFVIHGVISYIYDDIKFVTVDFILNTVKSVILYVIMALVVCFLNKNSGKDLIYGIQKMFNGNVFGGGVSSTMYALYTNILEPAIFVITALLLSVVIVNNLRFGISVKRSSYLVINGIANIKAVIVLLAISMGLHLILCEFIASGATSFQISLIGLWLKTMASTYIPLLLFSTVMLILIKFCHITIKKLDPVQSAEVSTSSAC